MGIATKEQSVIDQVAKQLYIGGEWRDASGGDTLPIEDPATGEALCEVADGTPEDAKTALDAAVAKQAEWAATPPNERSAILWRVFEALNERTDDLALLMTLEMGKVGPAIAAGCTMVWKPPQQTPLSAFALAQLLEEAGLPGGVLNIVTSSSSSSVAKPIIADPRLQI